MNINNNTSSIIVKTAQPVVQTANHSLFDSVTSCINSDQASLTCLQADAAGTALACGVVSTMAMVKAYPAVAAAVCGYMIKGVVVGAACSEVMPEFDCCAAQNEKPVITQPMQRVNRHDGIFTDTVYAPM